MTNDETARVSERPEVIEMLGSRLEILAMVATDGADAVLIRTTIAPGRGVPLHSHADFETFHVLTGEIEVYMEGSGWGAVPAGESLTVAHGERHAIRNVFDKPAELIVVTNNRLTSFFRDAGAEGGSGGPPSPAAVANVRAVARRYGYWMASSDEHAAIIN